MVSVSLSKIFLVENTERGREILAEEIAITARWGGDKHWITEIITLLKLLPNIKPLWLGDKTWGWSPEAPIDSAQDILCFWYLRWGEGRRYIFISIRTLVHGTAVLQESHWPSPEGLTNLDASLYTIGNATDVYIFNRSQDFLRISKA